MRKAPRPTAAADETPQTTLLNNEREKSIYSIFNSPLTRFYIAIMRFEMAIA